MSDLDISKALEVMAEPKDPKQVVFLFLRGKNAEKLVLPLSEVDKIKKQLSKDSGLVEFTSEASGEPVQFALRSSEILGISHGNKKDKPKKSLPKQLVEQEEGGLSLSPIAGKPLNDSDLEIG